MTAGELRLYSLFTSIQGESTRAGLPCVFVRLAGCPLSCTYCDTRDACESPGAPVPISQVVDSVLERGLPLVEVTGGEPLAQPGTSALLSALADAGLEVLLETSGAFPIAGLDPRVRVILDLKTPGSGMHGRAHLPNYDILDPARHELKIVVTGPEDFAWGLDFARRRDLEGRVEVLFSPVRGRVESADLVAWMLDSGCRGRLQLQLHRVIWPDGEEER